MPAWAAPFDAHPPASALRVAGVPGLSDNIFWLLHDPAGGRTVAIDPGEADPVAAEAARRGWTIDAVWLTHWHPDHVAGVPALAAAGATVHGPAAEADRLAAQGVRLDGPLADGDRLTLGDHDVQVWHLPGHTLGHLGFIAADGDAPLAFTGDTLFAMGCGRLFEGTPEQMHASLQRLATLPDATTVYPAHDYTLSNARFAAHLAPDDPAIAAALARAQRLRGAGAVTLPTSLAAERATNPFLRAADAADFAALRSAKDQF